MIASALQLLREGGDYEKVQVREIAEMSGVALGTVYRYFASKEHLFGCMQLEWMEELNRQIVSRPPAAKTDKERLRDVLRRSVIAFERWPQFFKVLMMLETTTDEQAAQVHIELTRRGAEIYTSAIQSEDATTSEAIMYTLGAVLYASLQDWVMGRIPIASVLGNIDNTLDLIFGGTIASRRRQR
jgi:AcrR family transcriptional regulator